MVDYAVAIDPLQDKPHAAVASAINALRKSQPLGTVNHTDFEALRNRPISFSIGTKQRGEQQGQVETQMSLWHAAQWKFLYRLVGDEICTLDYIPALIVIGDQWKFVASTYSNNMTVMWVDCVLGSTNSELGTFQVMAGIRRLGKWASDMYWPWYKDKVLHITS
ncbi:hypothetical protein AK830_g4229 [Neonectria ditissima]|uniref:PD-(D/E)XK nuclease-like domain-containing protein n=1 Tax=Neonectria ditissima TaxID=78410 RepID=A0A0P7BLV2_9HYPO|nr:hypothetical protein AK830_g4229 [Neonectria ditissima]